MGEIKFIADIGSNHNRDMERTLTLIQEAKRIGCDAVKFQLFHAENLFAACMNDEIRLCKSRELPIRFIPYIAEQCKQSKIKFGMTPFDLQAVDECKEYVDFFKISSFDILRKDLIKKIIECDKPVMFSTGYADDQEILNALLLIFSKINDVTIFHCISDYPVLVEDCRLYTINRFKERFTFGNWDNIKIGWSDHSCNPAVIYRAITEGARVVEFHLDIQYGDIDNCVGYEFMYGHCWDADDMEEVIEVIRTGEEACNPPSCGYLDTLEYKRLQRADPVDGLRPHNELRRKNET